MKISLATAFLSLFATTSVVAQNLQIPRGRKTGCKTTELFIINQEFQDAAVTTTSPDGATRGMVDIFYRSDDSLAGNFGAVETVLGTTSQVLEAGFISFYEDGTTDIQGSITFASIPTSGGTLFPVTGGVQSLGCARGVLKAAGFEDGRFFLDMVLCGKVCSMTDDDSFSSL